MASIFKNGVWSMGFDMSPTAGQVFTRIANGSASATARFGLGLGWNPSTGPAGVVFGANLANLYDGIALNMNGSMPGTSGIIRQWWDVTANVVQLSLRVFTDGHLQFFLGSGTGTPIGPPSATGVIAPTSYNYIEVKLIIGTGVGQVECRVNGNSSPVITTTATVTTQSSANAWVSAADLVNPFNSITTTVIYDDWYMLDTTGPVGPPSLATYLGAVEVRGDKPNANSAVGGRNAFTPTNPTNVNFSNVANVPFNAAEYNADQTPSDFDMFRFPALTATTVFFINFWDVNELDASGARTVSLDCYSAGTDALGPAFTPPSSPVLSNQTYVVDPNTGLPWTVGAAGSAELGMKVIT